MKMMKKLLSLFCTGLFAMLAVPAQADTTDVKTQSVVEVKKRGAHCADDPNCMNRYHYAFEPVAKARPGQLIRYETRDALDSDLNVNSQPKDVLAIDLNLVHPITGPVFIEGAQRGDVLAVTLIDVEPDEYGYTTIVPGFGFLRDLYPDPFVANWKINRLEAVSDEIPGVRIPMNAFMGTVGTLPGKQEVQAWLARETQLGAAGGIEAIFTVLSIRDQIAPPTINLDNPDTGCDLDYVPHTAREMKIDVAISNSFGFGGTNGSLVFGKLK